MEALMIIGAYQFAVTGKIKDNLKIIKKAIIEAASQNVKLLVFPECALTGYPPRDIASSDAINFHEVEVSLKQLQDMAVSNTMHIVVGSITKNEGRHYNSAVVCTPDRKQIMYHKRALWGWDKDNFCAGNSLGVFQIKDMKIGIRICYEVRFPEFFRELYRENTDLNVILFYDVSDHDDTERYEMIKSHIRTRAVENVCHTLTVNTTKPYQTAPSALYNKSAYSLAELKRNEEALLLYDLQDMTLDFGEQGRKEISDLFLLQKH